MIEQESPAKFLPAFFVDVVELGEEFKAGELPLHMTYFPPVKANFTPRIADNLRRLINPMPPFEAIVGQPGKLGDNFDIPVRFVEPSDQLFAVHRALVATLQYLPHDPKYRMPYNPHISMEETNTRLRAGDAIPMAGLSIVEKAPYGRWQVMAKIGLKGGLE